MILKLINQNRQSRVATIQTAVHVHIYRICLKFKEATYELGVNSNESLML